jgi:6-phosphogluconate dehydrogenase (decarboxylating)
MELGMIGLGKMGANMAERLLRAGHRVAAASDSLDSLIQQLTPPRAVWIMVPTGDPVDQTVVHNGIELMQAYAEGFELVRRKEEFQPDLHQIAEIWRFGFADRLLAVTRQEFGGHAVKTEG